MKVAELYRQKSFVFSIEIYPPKTQESLERLKIKLKEFRSYHPDFISVTYGAGGSTRENTHELASYIQNDLGIEAMAQLTCVFPHTPGNRNLAGAVPSIRNRKSDGPARRPALGKESFSTSFQRVCLCC